MEPLVGSLILALIVVAWCVFDDKVMQPHRLRLLRSAVQARYPDKVVLVTLQGSDAAREDAPDFDHICDATDEGLIFCQRRRFAGYVEVRFDTWGDVRPMTIDTAWRDELSLGVHGANLRGNVDALLSVARPFLTDPSGLLEAAVEAAPDDTFLGVLHGACNQGCAITVVPARPALLACTNAGILIVSQPRRRLGNWEPRPRVTTVGWDELPTVRIIDGPLPSVRVSWASQQFELRLCLLGDVSEFAAIAANSINARSSVAATQTTSDVNLGLRV